MQKIIVNKDTLIFDEFKFKCALGKKGTTSNKKEGDNKTPKGLYSIGSIYYRKDRITKFETKLKKKVINPNMGWCDDVNSNFYNKLIKINGKVRHEKLFRKDKIYDLVIPINYNMKNPIKNKGSAIFLHVSEKYEKTKGCVALKKKDLLILLKLINKKTKIKIL